jgi:hypothetical protein
MGDVKKKAYPSRVNKLTKSRPRPTKSRPTKSRPRPTKSRPIPTKSRPRPTNSRLRKLTNSRSRRSINKTNILNKKNTIHGGSGELDRPLEPTDVVEPVVESTDVVEPEDDTIMRRGAHQAVIAWQITLGGKINDPLPRKVENAPTMPANIASILIDTFHVPPITSKGSLLKLSNGHTINTVKKVIEAAKKTNTVINVENSPAMPGYIASALIDNHDVSPITKKGSLLILSAGNTPNTVAEVVKVARATETILTVENSPAMPGYIASELIDNHEVSPITGDGSVLKLSEGNTPYTVEKVYEEMENKSIKPTVENSPDMPANIASILIDTFHVPPITSNGSLLKISDGHTINTVKKVKVIEAAVVAARGNTPFADTTRIIDPSMTDNLKYSLLWMGVSVVMTDGNPVPINNEMYGWLPSNDISDLDTNFKSIITADDVAKVVREDAAWKFKILKAVIDGTGEYIKHLPSKWLGKKIEPIKINSSMILPIQHLLVIMGVNPVMEDGKAVQVYGDSNYAKEDIIEWLSDLGVTPEILQSTLDIHINLASTVAGQEDSKRLLGNTLAYSDQSATSFRADLSGLIARLKTPISDGDLMLSIQTTNALMELEVTLNKVFIPLNKFREEMTSEERDTVRQNIFKRFRDIDVIMPYIMSPMFSKLVTNVSPLLGDKVSSRHSSGLVANGLPAYLASKKGMNANDKILFKVLYDTLNGPLLVIESMVDTLDLTINRIIQESKPYIQVIDLIQQGLGALTSGGTRGYGPVSGSVPNIPYGLLLTTAFIGTEGMGSNALREKIKHDYKVHLKTLPTELRSETVREAYGDYVNQLDLFNKLHPETIDINGYLQNLKELLYGLAATLSKYLHNLDIINYSFPFMDYKLTSEDYAVVKKMDTNYLDQLRHQEDGKTMGSLYSSINRICEDFKATVSTNISGNTEIRMDVMSGHSDIQQTLRTPNESLSKHGGPYFGADTLLAPMLPIEYTTKSSGTTKTDGKTTETALNESVSEDASVDKNNSYNVMNLPPKWRKHLSPKSDRLSHDYPVEPKEVLTLEVKNVDAVMQASPAHTNEIVPLPSITPLSSTTSVGIGNAAAQIGQTPTSTTPLDDDE